MSPTPAGPLPVTALSLVKSAMWEINILSAGGTPSAQNGAWGLEKLQRLVDKLNAIRQAIFSVNFTEFTLIPNHAPHTMGPGGDFDVTPRPVKIVAASFILNAGTGNNQVDAPPIIIRDADWWAVLPTKTLISTISRYLYYSPDVPLGNCNFWPICSLANPVRLEFWSSLLVPIALNTQLTYPQGYWDAIVLTLAVEMCSAFGKSPDPTLAERQRLAMAVIMGNNAKPPRIRTDSSMPQPFRSGRPDFDFLTGLNDNN